MLEIRTKRELIDLSSPQFTTQEVPRFQPLAEATYQERGRERDKAAAETQRLKHICDDNSVLQTFLIRKLNELSGDSTALDASLRDELFATRQDFAFEDNASRRRAKIDAMELCGAALDFVVVVKAPGDNLLYLDAVANERRADHSELSAAVVLNHVNTIIAAKDLIDSEPDGVGFICASTERLKDQVEIAAKRVEAAEYAAREARVAFDRQQAAQHSMAKRQIPR